MNGSIGTRVELGARRVRLRAGHRAVLRARRRDARYGADMAPAWADALKVGASCAAILGFVAVVSADPSAAAEGAAGQGHRHSGADPDRCRRAAARRSSPSTRFGRYVFAYGGPEAALLSGLPTRRVLLLLFALMGVLAALASVITTGGSARGALDRPDGRALRDRRHRDRRHLAGRRGGHDSRARSSVRLLIQSLDNGMVLMDVSAPKRQISSASILIAAVWSGRLPGNRGMGNEPARHRRPRARFEMRIGIHAVRQRRHAGMRRRAEQ